jgi:hypothetical protein
MISLATMQRHIWRRTLWRSLMALVLVSGMLLPAQLPAKAADCTKTSWPGLVALPDLGTGAYQTYPGGLYPGSSNQMPSDYLHQGLYRTQAVITRDASGLPSSQGKIGLISIGMSNTTMEFSVFKSTADADADKNPKLVIVDTAEGGKDAEKVKNAGDDYWTMWVPQHLSAAGVSAAQVQAAWLKEAIATPSNFGGFPASTQLLQADLEAILTILTTTFPNLQLVYVSNRTYAGYASTTLNPEPYAYESSFAVKWLVEKRIQTNPTDRPWVAWGAYLWTNGTAGRSDGLTWQCSDTASDGTHPSASGQQKVAGLLLNFFKTDPTAQPWFTKFGWQVHLPLVYGTQ